MIAGRERGVLQRLVSVLTGYPRRLTGFHEITGPTAFWHDVCLNNSCDGRYSHLAGACLAGARRRHAVARGDAAARGGDSPARGDAGTATARAAGRSHRGIGGGCSSLRRAVRRSATRVAEARDSGALASLRRRGNRAARFRLPPLGAGGISDAGLLGPPSVRRSLSASPDRRPEKKG